ncbi:hypothetical protein C9374_003409 [Naegleria lovaniensis]|uniref:C3H1-type domain-containing protein n=1 Tax=Naegleria lovaniensis TaxID=51637 RepID=A0AA88GTN2_NAELO|nr:uncharacterized protein C9374_003409 [Naegleria lovaniensis]KAG2385594.1 hypothetical protein C9374_003409 [Naegleria lovaniensis]
MVDVTERIKTITNNYKITKKEYIETFMNICRDLKFSPTSHKETIKSGRLECAKVLNATIKKNILKMFIDADGLSLISEWITDALDQIDENLIKELVNAIKDKLNNCGGLTVANVKKSKIGKALNSVTKSTIISKPIKTSVDELIQDWKQKFVQETSTTDSKKKSSTLAATSTTSATSSNAEKRKQRPESDNTENASTSMSPTIDTSIPMKKKVKTDDRSPTTTTLDEASSSSTGKKKKKVSWSSTLEQVQMIEPRSAYIEENAGQNSNGSHKTVQELMNEEKSRERTLLNQQRQLKQLILSNMTNTVNGVSPLRPILVEHKSDQIPDLSSTEASRIAAEVKKSQSKMVIDSPKSPDTVPNIAEISNLLNATFGTLNRLNPIPITNISTGQTSSMPTSYVNNPSTFPTTSTPHHHTIVSPSHPISPSVATTVFQQSPYYRPQPSPQQQPPSMMMMTTNISQPPHPSQPSHHPSRQPNHHHHPHNRQSSNRSQQQSKPRPPLNPPPPPQGPVEPRSFKPIKCLFYLKGNCKNGTKCGFYHEGYDIPPQEGVEEYNFEKAKYFQSLKNTTVGPPSAPNNSQRR